MFVGTVGVLSCGSGIVLMSMSTNGCCAVAVLPVNNLENPADSNVTLTVVTECAETSVVGVLVTHGVDVAVGATNAASC